MNKEAEFKHFLESEWHKIEIDKWYEGCKVHHDPGQAFVLDWIQRNAKWFRNAWDESICKECEKWKECGWKVKKECENFEKEG